MKRRNIAVSGINSGENPGPGMGIIRSLKESGQDYCCVGLSYDAMDSGLYLEQYVDKAFLLPYPSADSADYIARLLQICEQNDIEAIIPALDSELPHYVKNFEQFQQKNIGLNISSKDLFESMTKVNLPALGEKINIKVPRTIPVTSLEELNLALDKVGFPAMVKGCFYEAYCVHSYFEAQSFYQQLANKWGYPVLVQQFLTGNDYNLAGLAGKEGGCLGLVAIKKLMLTQMGKVWTAVTIQNPKMLEIGRKFIQTTGYRGGFELEFRMTNKDELYLLEINPRFPAWIYLGTGAGINLPFRYVANLLDDEAEFSSHYESGKLLVRYAAELIRDINDFKQIVVKGERA